MTRGILARLRAGSVGRHVAGLDVRSSTRQWRRLHAGRHARYLAGDDTGKKRWTSAGLETGAVGRVRAGTCHGRTAARNKRGPPRWHSTRPLTRCHTRTCLWMRRGGTGTLAGRWYRRRRSKDTGGDGTGRARVTFHQRCGTGWWCTRRPRGRKRSRGVGSPRRRAIIGKKGQGRRAASRIGARVVGSMGWCQNTTG
jgi:hypothetical protein